VALEFYTRWCIGQFDVPDSVEFRPEARAYREARQQEEPDLYNTKQELLDKLRTMYFPELRGPGHSYGVGWNDKREQQEAQTGYEIYKAILYEFNRGKDNVHSYPNILHYSDQPVPKFIRLPDDAQ
jgi:hypothetical protein